VLHADRILAPAGAAAARACRVFRTIQAPRGIFAKAPDKLRDIACCTGRAVRGRARARFVTEIA